MLYALASEHIHVFHKEGWILFEDLVDGDKLAALGPEGHDLFRTNKALMRRVYAEIALGLVDKDYLRLVYSQTLVSPLTAEQTLQDISSFSMLEVGMIIVLESESVKPGSGIFLTPDCPFERLPSFTKGVLVVYAAQESRYIFNPNDPHTHYLKKLGYGFGDNLNVTTHPLLYKL